VPFALALLTDLQTALEDLSAVEAVRGRAARALDAARDVLGELRFRYQEVELSLGRGSGRARIVEDDLRRAIERVGQVADARDRGVLLLYDEFQELRDDRKAGQFPLGALVGGLAAAQQESLPVMLAASGLPPLVEHLSAAQSYTERMFEGQRIGALSEGEAARALTQPTRNGPVRFAPEVVREVVQRAGRYPYFIQHYGRELWDAAEKGAVDLDALSRAGEDARRKLDDYFFRSRLARATPAERALMIQIAEFGEGATTQQLIERTGRRNNSLAMVVRGLIDKGLVFRPARGEVAFSAPLFGDYLRRRAHEV